MNKNDSLKCISYLSGVIGLLAGKWKRPHTKIEVAILQQLQDVQETIRKDYEATESDWLKLTPKQREDVVTLRDRMNRHLIAETEAFYAQHSELKLIWAFVCDALIRERR